LPRLDRNDGHFSVIVNFTEARILPDGMKIEPDGRLIVRDE
jgi:hypothetical protein